MKGRGREGEGEEREGREGAHHSAQRKSKGPRENVMWPAVRPDILFLSLFLWLSMWAGRNGDRKQPPHPLFLPSSPPTLLQRFTHSLLMSPLLSTTPFSSSSLSPTIPPSTPLLRRLLSGPSFRISLTAFLFFCLPHPQACL